jgi:hypothetical protein
MQQIRFIKFGSNTALGNFAPGEIARCDAKLARHLVEEAKVARYELAAVSAHIEPEPEAEPSAPRRTRVRRSTGTARGAGRGAGRGES